jgi:hypothetical protein
VESDVWVLIDDLILNGHGELPQVRIVRVVRQWFEDPVLEELFNLFVLIHWLWLLLNHSALNAKVVQPPAVQSLRLLGSPALLNIDVRL